MDMIALVVSCVAIVVSLFCLLVACACLGMMTKLTETNAKLAAAIDSLTATRRCNGKSVESLSSHYVGG